MSKTQTAMQHRFAFLALAVMALVASQAQAQVAKPYFEFKKPKMIAIDGDLSHDINGLAAPVSNPSGAYVFGFEGVSQYDGSFFGRNFIPPDTIGAVGASQYMATTNGAYAVFNKTTGVRTSLVSDVAFWAAAGQTGANGDSRVMYSASANRWIAMSFGANAKDLQIAVSNTSDALGGWQSTKFEGYGGLGFGATADYPTLAMDRNAVYIGTNNFAPASSGGTNSFRGTTMNVIPLDSLFSAGAPTTSNMKQFVTPYVNGSGSNVDRGFAQQGVNSSSAGSTGKVVATSLFDYDTRTFNVTGLSSSSATGSAVTASVGIGEKAFESPSPAHQPSAAIAANRAVVDAGDERISSAVYEANGRIYMVKTVDPVANGVADNSRIRYTVLDANTNAILDEGDIGQAGYDYYQGSIAVNELGQVVIGYNRSGLDAATGKISFMGQSFNTAANGHLVSQSGELLLKESLVDDYHNGSLFGQAAAGRQRWGDYSSVSVDPTDSSKFYLIGEFAREYNNADGGHPGGTGGSRWGTWIAVIDANVAAVPEPSSWLMLVCGISAVGFVAHRRRRNESLAA
ncbi:PEP-CTERM sorting domain-containing protein [Paucibacter sp. B2R-40]|uniref:PEP-CTERM sorting domain-containing protein n=1 Tax=Paucibacter sp. B2R-40 TaxID=2893554 RepID=UPI0021E471E7|nr:PEP-CTERM sorting domain-containing protein [Paucibacter sp. B2R-40]MCV2353681.1 PEP-CTERM sorting domain-containing protein [Paucibacter sp. B2R-40]